MRVVVQRSGVARCEVDNVVTGHISSGMVILVSIDSEETPGDVEWMVAAV